MSIPNTISNIPSGWNRVDSFVVQLTPTFDPSAAPIKTYYTFDGTEPSELSPFFGPNMPDGITTVFPISGVAIHTIKYFSVDNNGNKELTKTQELKLNNVAPVTTITSTNPNGLNDWYVTNIFDINLTAQSFGMTSVVDIFYKWDSGIFSQFTTNLSIPSEGIHTLFYYAVDSAGNVEQTKSKIFKFDVGTPTSQAEFPVGTQKQPVTITFFYSDLVSGVENIYYTFTTDGTVPDDPRTSANAKTGTSVTFAENGSYKIKFNAKDFAGNWEDKDETEIFEIKIDTTVPNVYVSEDHLIDGNNGWYRIAPEISLSSTDESEIIYIKYKLHETGVVTTAKYISPVDLSTPINLTSNYNVTIQVDQDQFRTIDLRGVIPGQTTISEIVNLINNAFDFIIAEETNEQGEQGNGFITLTSPTAATSSPTSEIKFLDPESNDATLIVFGLDDNYPHIYTETVVFVDYHMPFTLPYNGYWSLEYFAADIEGNISPVQSKQYKFDGIAPSTNVSEDLLPDGLPAAETPGIPVIGWYVNNNPKITFEYEDNVSGISKTYYQWNNVGTWNEYSPLVEIIIPSDGINTLTYYSVDNAGNIESFKYINYCKDNISPVTADNTLELQGIIFTTKGVGYQLESNENSTWVSYSQVKTYNKNVVSVLSIFDRDNIVSTDPLVYQEYYATQIQGADKDELEIYPVTRNENPETNNIWRDVAQQKLKLKNTPLLVDVGQIKVLKLLNKTNGFTYGVDPSISTPNDGWIKLSGPSFALTDVFEIDYVFDSVPLPQNHTLEVTYYFSYSHRDEALNTLERTILIPYYVPYIYDYTVQVILTGNDSESGLKQTFYTIDGTDPEIIIGPAPDYVITLLGTTQTGNVITLSETGSYKIKYFSIDNAGNQENVKTALYEIVIDKKIPSLNLTVDAPTGTNGWHKLPFKLYADIQSNDIIKRLGQKFLEVSNFKITVGENDKLDYKIGLTEFAITIDDGYYTTDELLTEIQTKLGGNFLVSKIQTPAQALVESGYRIKIENTSTAFDLLWSSGINASSSIGKEIFFNISSDDIGLLEYTSDYFGLKIDNSLGIAKHFIRSVESIYTSIGETYEFISRRKGYTQFYDEILVDGIISENEILCDYHHYIGIDKVNFSLDTVALDIVVPIRDDVSKFIGFDEIVHTTGLATGYIGSDIVTFDSGILPLNIENALLTFGTESVYVKERINATSLKIQGTLSLDHIDSTYILELNKIKFLVEFQGALSDFYMVNDAHIVYAKAYDFNSVQFSDVPQKQSGLIQLSFKLDLIAPVTTDTSIINPNFQKAPIYIQLNPVDVISGVSDTFYSIDGSYPSLRYQDLPNNRIELTVSGVFIIKYYSIDKAGNQETVKESNVIYSDAIAPETLISTDPSVPDGNNNWFKNYVPDVILTASDIESGIDKIYYKLPTDIDWNEHIIIDPLQSFVRFTLPYEGAINIQFYAIDKVGNTEIVKTGLVKYDHTPPVTQTNIP